MFTLLETAVGIGIYLSSWTILLSSVKFYHQDQRPSTVAELVVSQALLSLDLQLLLILIEGETFKVTLCMKVASSWGYIILAPLGLTLMKLFLEEMRIHL